MAAGRTDVADELDLDARVLHLLPTGDLDLHLTRRTGSQSQRQRLCACTRHCGMGGGSRTVPHTLSDALNRYCSTSFSFTLVVTVCRVSASANVTLNFAGAPVKKELSDITRRETPTPSLVSQPASCGQVEGCERLAGRVVGERAATGSGAGSSARPALRGSTGGEARRRAGTNKRALSSGITTDSQRLALLSAYSVTLLAPRASRRRTRALRRCADAHPHRLCCFARAGHIMADAHVFWQLDGSIRVMVYTLVVAHVGALVCSTTTNPPPPMATPSQLAADILVPVRLQEAAGPCKGVVMTGGSRWRRAREPGLHLWRRGCYTRSVANGARDGECLLAAARASCVICPHYDVISV